MENLTGEDKQKIGIVVEDVYKEFSARVKLVEEISIKLEKKMNLFQPKLINYLKGVCKKEYDWIEQHSKVVESDGQVRIEVEDKFKNEAESRFKEWEDCSKVNDLGVKKYFDTVEEENNSFRLTHDACMRACIKDVQRKSNTELFNCFKPCFSVLFDKSESSIKNALEKVNEFDSKL